MTDETLKQLDAWVGGGEDPIQIEDPDMSACMLEPETTLVFGLAVAGAVNAMCGWLRAAGRRLTCDHGLTFDRCEAAGMSAAQIREKYPRLYGPCPNGCGYDGIAYASMAHFVMGDW